MRPELNALRQEMTRQGIDYCLVLTDDFHASEYTGAYFKARSYLTGFTGSAGTALVGKEWAGLWTDGRYFLQAAMQLKDSGFELMKSEQPNVPDVKQYLRDHLEPGQVLAFDGRTMTVSGFRDYQKVAEEKGASLRTDVDLVDRIWKDRPPLPVHPVYELEERYTGRSRGQKIQDVRRAVAEASADCLILSSLTDICYLLNIRGGDVACTPVVLAYCILDAESVSLFVNPGAVPTEIAEHLRQDGVRLCPYEDVYSAVAGLPVHTRVMLDPKSVNSAVFSRIPSGCSVVEKQNPTVPMKAVKNPTEIANMRKAHILDGVAVTRFLYWIKNNVGRVPVSEISAAEKLESFRREQPGYLGPSFSPIMAYGPHGAIVHYSATPESSSMLEGRSFLLADTGGHSLEGTTDITRTIALGELTDEEKAFYTLVLLGHLHLGDARFLYGCSGANLDYLAREPLWRRGYNYNHGTGHGVGYVLSVHEGPQSFRWQKTDRIHSAILEAGMITSDEPGIYLDGKFGVRLENLTVVVDDVTNEYGRFMRMEYLTMVPFDLDALDLSLMTEYDRELLNEYHQSVYDAIAPLLPPEEAQWLRQATRKV